MKCRLAVEDVEAGHWVAYVLDMPGCFSSGESEEAAIAGIPAKVEAYFNWVSGHGFPTFLPDDDVAYEVVESFQSYESPTEPGYLVNAFFMNDHKPLGYWEVQTALRLMTWTREDLFELTKSLSQAQLSMTRTEGEAGTIADILRHLAISENWYLDRLGLALPREDISGDVFGMLSDIRERARRGLVELIGDKRVVTLKGERWSGRKIIRRLLWHERDHTFQISKLLS